MYRIDRDTHKTHTTDGYPGEITRDVVFTIESRNYVQWNYLNFLTFRDIKSPVGVTRRPY